jgi:hypothetical protein
MIKFTLAFLLLSALASIYRAAELSNGHIAIMQAGGIAVGFLGGLLYAAMRVSHGK